MRDIINATIDEKHFLKCSTYTIARNGEGLTPCLSISIPDGLKSYWAYIDFKKSNGESIKSPRIDVEENKIFYAIPSGVLDTEGVLEIQVIFKNENGKKWKTYVKEFAVRYSINATDDIPDKEDFITEAQKLLDEIEERANNGDLNNYYTKTETDTLVKNSIKIWQPNTEYKVGDCCLMETIGYLGATQTVIAICIKNHISSTMPIEDIADKNWKINLIYAETSIRDGQGNSIFETYATKYELTAAIGEALEGDY